LRAVDVSALLGKKGASEFDGVAGVKNEGTFFQRVFQGKRSLQLVFCFYVLLLEGVH
jgi:hypothetical protein